jgi:hypothetical protein
MDRALTPRQRKILRPRYFLLLDGGPTKDLISRLMEKLFSGLN